MVEHKTKGGRPQKYTHEELRIILLEYVHDNPGEQITLSKLGRETKFPQYVWKNNKEIRKDIERLNNAPLEVTSLLSEYSGIPSAEDLINHNYNNKKKLIDTIQNILDAYQKTFEDSLKLEELEKLLYSKEKEIDNLKEEVEFYKNKYEEMTIKSTSIRGRKENHLKENVLDIEKFKEKSETEDELADLFK